MVLWDEVQSRSYVCPVCGPIKDIIPPLTKEEVQKYYTSPVTPAEESAKCECEDHEEKCECEEGREGKCECEEGCEEMSECDDGEFKEEKLESHSEEKHEENTEEKHEESNEEKHEESNEEKHEENTEEEPTAESLSDDEARIEQMKKIFSYKDENKGLLFYRYRTPDNKRISRIALNSEDTESDRMKQPLLPPEFFDGVLPPDIKKTDEMVALQNRVREEKGIPPFIPIYVPVVVPVVQEPAKQEVVEKKRCSWGRGFVVEVDPNWRHGLHCSVLFVGFVL